jgi:hypothetical protein
MIKNGFIFCNQSSSHEQCLIFIEQDNYQMVELNIFLLDEMFSSEPQSSVDISQNMHEFNNGYNL